MSMLSYDHEVVSSVARRVYRRMVDVPTNDWGMTLAKWDWVPGVGAISILEYGKHMGDTEVLNFLQSWVEDNRNLAGQVKVINSMAPYAIFPEMYRFTGNSWYLETAVEIAEWMVLEAPRTREQAFEHTVTENAMFPEQVWADTIFMAVLFLARLAKLTGEKKYAEEAVFQLMIHLRLLQDPRTGVLFHGWNCKAGDHMSGARWTRANAWVAVAAPLIAEEVSGLIEFPAEIIDRYRAMAKGWTGFQTKQGLWSTVMDHPDYYSETSGSAGIAAGLWLGVNNGWLDESALDCVRKALPGVLAKVAADGTVLDVSGGTPVMPDIPAYNRIPCIPTLYGQGLVLILLSNLIGKQSR